MNLFVQDGIVQKPISLHNWKMIASCKGYCKTVTRQDGKTPLETVQEYLKCEYLQNDNYLNDSDLYIFLLDTIFDVCNENEIKNIWKIGIRDQLRYNQLFNNDNSNKLSYNDLCTVLASTLDLLQVREIVQGRVIDKFIIYDDTNKMMSIDEAESMWLNSPSQAKEQSFTKDRQ